LIADLNPLGKVPVLVLEDGVSVFDSRVIVDYLDTLTPVAHLIPRDAKSRMMVRGIEALADGMIDAAVASFLERKRAAEKQDADWITLQEKALYRGLKAMADALGDKALFLGLSMTLADIAAGCALGYLDLRYPQLAWRETHPNLAALAGRLAERASFKDTIAVI